MNMLPSSRPKITFTEIEAMIKKEYPLYEIPEILFIGIRGYYKDTMGEAGSNDRKLYDDAIFIMTPTQLFSFNGNTDPGAFKPGIANLKAGIWPVYKFDMHNGKYMALCQRAGKVTVIRDGTG